MIDQAQFKLFKGINRAILAISFARFADALGNSLMFVLMPLYIASLATPNLSWSDSILVSLAIALYGLVNTVLQPLSGVISDRVPLRKPFIIAGLFLMAVGTLALAFAKQYVSILLIRGLQGVGVALTVPASLALINSETVKETRGRAMGFYSTLRLLGFAIGPLVGGFLHGKYGFEISFYVGAGAIFTGTLLVQQWVKEEPRERNAAPRTKHKWTDPRIWNPNIVSLGAAMFMMASAYSMMSALENEFNARLQQTALGFGIAFSALTFSRMLVQSPLGYVSDKIGRKPLIVTGLILMAPATALLGFVGTTLQLTGARALQGITSAAISAPTFALAGDLSTEEEEGRQMSIITTGFFLGITVGPLLAGFLSTYYFWLPFSLGGLMLLIGAGIVAWQVSENVSEEDQETH
jgi:MFS family permease